MGNGPMASGAAKTEELLASMRRAGTAQRILEARCDGRQPSDVTFAQWRADGQFHNFATAHYDWWMFPWTAAASDSGTGRHYSVLAGDVADLLLSSPREEGARLLPFSRRYSASTNALFDALRVGGVDPVRSAHPARKSKIFASLLFFEGVARSLGCDADADEYAALRAEFVRLFGPVERRWLVGRTDTIAQPV